MAHLRAVAQSYPFSQITDSAPGANISAFAEVDRMLRTDRYRQEISVIVIADLLRHQLVEQAVHTQDKILILLAIEGEIVQLVGILLQVEQLNVVVLKDLVESLRRVERGGRVVAGELVASVERKGHESAFVEVRVLLEQCWKRLAEEDILVCIDQIVTVDRLQADVIEEHTG